MSVFNKLPARLVFLSALAWFPAAHAGDYYAAVDASINRITIASTDFSPRLARIRAGYEFSKYAVELQYAAGASEDAVNQLTVEVDQQIGAYFRVNYGLNPKAKIYLSLGVAQTSINRTLSGVTESDDYQDLSYNIGIEDYYPWVRDLRIVLEYSEYYKDNDLEIKGLSLGIRYNF